MPNLDTVARFTWMWGMEFHLQVGDKAYVWSDPDYGGDNTIRPYPYTDKEMGRRHRKDPIAWGRDKGTRTIRDFCGDKVTFLV